jgi:hypothetical protein
MKPIAQITDKRVAGKCSSTSSAQRRAGALPGPGTPGPPESLGSAPWFDDDPRAHDDTNWTDLA